MTIFNYPVFFHCLTFQASSTRTRSGNLFYLKSQTINYVTNTELQRIMNIVGIYEIYPFCSTSFHSFKKRVFINLV